MHSNTTKMNRSQKTLCLRILVIVFTILIWFIGAAIFGFSIYLRVDYWINQYILASEELTAYQTYVYIFIGTGAAIIVFGIIGLVGAAKPDKLCLIVYAVFLPLVLIALVFGGAYAYIYRESIEGTIKNSKMLQELVKRDYGGPKLQVTRALDFMQVELQCCGGQGFQDYLESQWSQDAPLLVEHRKDKAPITCCADVKRYEDIQAPEYQYCSMYIEDQSNSGQELRDKNPNIWKTGCGEAFVRFIQKHIATVAAIAFSIAALLLIAIVCVIMLLVMLRRRPMPREDDVVYEMARTQEKSPYPARGGPYANLYQS